MRALVVGGGAREHALAATLDRAHADVYVASSNANPGLDRLAKEKARLDPTDGAKVAAFALRERIELALIGPDPALAAGVADALRAAGIPTFGPSQAAAKVEW